MQRRSFLVGAAALVASPAAAQMPGMHGMHGMGGHAGTRAPALPEGAPLAALPRLANEAKTPGLFRATLTAGPAEAEFVPGLLTPILAYNGHSPGPLIELAEGDRVEIGFANRIQGEASTIHWHGMAVPADQDGNPMDPVTAGAGRVYAFTVPEGSAGPYWYHPHPHGHTAEQVYRGLAGAIIVKPKHDPVPAEYGDTVLMFTDLRLAPDGTMPASTMSDMMNGRVGDDVLVNGQKNPVLALARGEKRRLRLYNATNARYLRMSFGAPVTLIGTDGGLLTEPVAAREFMLAPAERVELIVQFDQPGRVALTTLAYERGWMGPGKPADAGLTLLTIAIGAEAAPAQPPLPARLRPIAALGAPVATRRFVFSERMGMGMGRMTMDFLINGRAFDMNRVDVVARLGAVELWEVANDSDMDHPFHLHGTQFQLVEQELGGRITRPAYLAWKDTINVPPRAAVRLKLRQALPGPRMYHCHILEHEQLGMMGIVDVRA